MASNINLDQIHCKYVTVCGYFGGKTVIAYFLYTLFLVYDNHILCVSRHLAELTRPVTQTTHNSVWHICSQHMLLRMVFLG